MARDIVRVEERIYTPALIMKTFLFYCIISSSRLLTSDPCQAL